MVQNAPILGMLRETLSWLTQRQKTLADNVANANTPGYVPNDIGETAFERALSRRMSSAGAPALTVTAARHIVTPPGQNRMGLRAESAPDSDMTINGNAVVLEEQMTKVIDTQMRYETVVGLYQKSLSLVRTAARPAGR